MAEIKFNLLEIDLGKKTSKVVDWTPNAKTYLAGRGLAAKYLWDAGKVEDADLLNGDKNLLHVGIGPLTGLIGDLVCVSFMSPLHNKIGRACSGGTLGAELQNAQYNCGIMVKGKADKPTYVVIYDDKVEFHDASELNLWGMTQPKVHTTLIDDLQKKHHQNFATIAIGPAGENMVRYAHATISGMHSASKFGPGAIFGSKNLKAIAVKGTKGPMYADHKAVWDLMKNYAMAQATADNKLARGMYGIASAGNTYYTGGCGVKNNHTFWDPICDTYNVTHHTLPYKPWITACPSCAQPCYAMYYANGKNGAVAGKHLYDNTFGFAANILVDYETQNHITAYLDTLGMDGEELGGLVAWAMDLYDNGIITQADVGYPLKWGDAEAAMHLMHDVAYRQGKVANALADGFTRAYKVFGDKSIWFASEVHGCAADTQDVRWKGSTNVGRYGTSHMGARKGNTAIEALREAATACSFLLPGSMTTLYGTAEEVFAKFLNAVCGWNVTKEDMVNMEDRNFYLHRMVSIRQGYNAVKDFKFPERYWTEDIKDKYGNVYKLTNDFVNGIVGKYNIEQNHLTKEGLIPKDRASKLGLDFAMKDLAPEHFG